MKVQQFLDHHGIARNPFAEEDAQTDPVFKEHCIDSTYHPTWDKVYGDPSEPATSIIFGEKGSGKTAMRLQLARHLEHYNRPASGPAAVRRSLRRLQSVPRPLPRPPRQPQPPGRTVAGPVEALGPHGRDPLAGRDGPRRSHPGSQAAEPGGRLRHRRRATSTSSTATRPATCCCSPPATTNRRPRRSRAAGTGCGGG